jgi:hypothetical protein
MQEPQSRSPREVRMQEIFDTYQHPTARAIAFRRFEVEERNPFRRRNTWR